jgi:hypothetical protein
MLEDCPYQAALLDAYRPEFVFDFDHAEQIALFMSMLDWDIINDDVLDRLNGSNGVLHYIIAQSVVFCEHHQAMDTQWGEGLEWEDESIKHYDEFMVPFLSEVPA